MNLYFFLFSYDSVDKALLDIPHSIRRIEIQLEKAGREEATSDILPAKIPASPLNNEPAVMQKELRQKQRQAGNSINALIEYSIVD